MTRRGIGRQLRRVIGGALRRTQTTRIWIRALAEDASIDETGLSAVVRGAIAFGALAGAAACDRIVDAMQRRGGDE